jgi:hypothetical protein
VKLFRSFQLLGHFLHLLAVSLESRHPSILGGWYDFVSYIFFSTYRDYSGTASEGFCSASINRQEKAYNFWLFIACTAMHPYLLQSCTFELKKSWSPGGQMQIADWIQRKKWAEPEGEPDQLIGWFGLTLCSFTNLGLIGWYFFALRWLVLQVVQSELLLD